MIASRFSQFAFIPVWAPRFHDRVVLLSVNKVKRATTENIKIRFTKTKTEELQGDWAIKKKQAMKAPIETNGVIDCFVVKLADLEPIEYVLDHEIINK